MRYRSSFSPLRSIERTFILTQIPIAECAARPPHNLPRVRSLAAFGRRPWCSPLHLDGPSSETLEQTEKSGLAHRQVRFAFKNGHLQCGYWSRSIGKCPLAIAPRHFTCRSFLHLQGGAIEGRHHGLHQLVLGNVGVRTVAWLREVGSRRN